MKQHDAEAGDAPLTLLLYPAGQHATELYRDDGVSQAYRRGEYSLIRFTSRQEERRLTVTITPPDDRKNNLKAYAATAPVSVTVDGAVLASWRHADGVLMAALPAGAANVEMSWA